MKKLIAIAMVSVSLGACTQLKNVVGQIENTKINGKSAYVAIQAFNAVERTTTNYLNLPGCNGAIALCRQSGAAAALEKPFNAGISARNSLRAFMKANPGTLADAGLYNTLTSATSALQGVLNAYGINSQGSK